MAVMTALCPHAQIFTEEEIRQAEENFRKKPKRSQEFAELDEAIRKKIEARKARNSNGIRV